MIFGDKKNDKSWVDLEYSLCLVSLTWDQQGVFLYLSHSRGLIFRVSLILKEGFLEVTKVAKCWELELCWRKLRRDCGTMRLHKEKVNVFLEVGSKRENWEWSQFSNLRSLDYRGTDTQCEPVSGFRLTQSFLCSLSGWEHSQSCFLPFFLPTTHLPKAPSPWNSPVKNWMPVLTSFAVDALQELPECPATRSSCRHSSSMFECPASIQRD